MSSSSSSSPSPSRAFTRSYITCVVTAYFVISIALVFTNKVLLSTSKPNDILSAPLFVTWYQCALSAIILMGLGHLATLFGTRHQTATAATTTTTTSAASSFLNQFTR